MLMLLPKKSMSSDGQMIFMIRAYGDDWILGTVVAGILVFARFRSPLSSDGKF